MILFPLLLLLTSPFSYEVELPFDEVPITEPITVILHLTYPKDNPPDRGVLQSHLTSFYAPGPPPFSLLEEESTLSPGNPTEETIYYTLSPQIVGKHTLSFFSIPFEKSSEILKTTPFTIEVTPPEHVEAVSPAPLLPIATPYPIEIRPQNKKEWVDGLQEERVAKNRELYNQRSLPWISLFLLTFGLIALYLSYKFQNKEEAPPPKTPAQSANEELEALEQRELPQKGAIEPFYIEITEIVREYIENEYQINAPHLTTEEFLHSLEKKPILNKHEELKLAAFLILADRVKFAHYPSSEKECKEMLRCAKGLINRT